MSTEDLSPENVPTMLATIHNLECRRLEIDWQIAVLVKACIEGGSTWRSIGKALGVSPQAAWHKHRPPEAPKIRAGKR